MNSVDCASLRICELHSRLESGAIAGRKLQSPNASGPDGGYGDRASAGAIRGPAILCLSVPAAYHQRTLERHSQEHGVRVS